MPGASQRQASNNFVVELKKHYYNLKNRTSKANKQIQNIRMPMKT